MSGLVFQKEFMVSQPWDLGIQLPQIKLIKPCRVLVLFPRGHIPGKAQPFYHRSYSKRSLKLPSRTCQALRTMNSWLVHYISMLSALRVMRSGVTLGMIEIWYEKMIFHAAKVTNNQTKFHIFSLLSQNQDYWTVIGYLSQWFQLDQWESTVSHLSLLLLLCQ